MSTEQLEQMARQDERNRNKLADAESRIRQATNMLKSYRVQLHAWPTFQSRIDEILAVLEAE